MNDDFAKTFFDCIKTPDKNVGQWICYDCGEKYGYKKIAVQTYHVDKCEYCGDERACTETRDWGYPELPEVKSGI